MLQIRVFVVASKSPEPEVVFARDYRASQQAEEPTADALVAALNQCLEQILTALEEDLSSAI